MEQESDGDTNYNWYASHNRQRIYKATGELGLVWFYGMSTVVGYLLLNPFLYKKTVLFHII